MTTPLVRNEHSPPFLHVDGLENFRDIGTWPTSTPNVTVRDQVLYRGPDLATITAKGEEQLRNLGIDIIFDIRSTPQIHRAGGVQEIPGIQRVWCPVFEDSEYTPEKAGLRYTQYSSAGTDARSILSPKSATHSLIGCPPGDRSSIRGDSYSWRTNNISSYPAPSCLSSSHCKGSSVYGALHNRKQPFWSLHRGPTLPLWSSNRYNCIRVFPFTNGTSSGQRSSCG